MKTSAISLIAGGRPMFIALAAGGFLLCSIGMGRLATTLGWTHWSIIAGNVLGAMALGLILTTLFNISLPLIAGYRQASIVLLAIIIAKIAIAVASRAL